MQEKYQPQGFAIIASHCQDTSLKDKALGLCRSNRVNYTVTSFGRPVGDESRGIPQAYLFDWTGKCVAEGHPSELYSKIDELMAKAPHYLTGGREFASKDVDKVAKKLRSNKNYGKLLGELEKLSTKLSGEAAEEAKYLHGRVLEHGVARLAKAREAEGENAAQAERSYKQLSSLYKGTETGSQAAARLKELKKDKAFQKELKASKILAQMEAVAGQIRSDYKPEHPANRRPVTTLVKLYKKLKKKYPDSKAFERAGELVKPYGL